MLVFTMNHDQDIYLEVGFEDDSVVQVNEEVIWGLNDTQQLA
jgi:hypothetical protein